MDQDRFTTWFVTLLPALWACLLSGIMLVTGTRLISRLVVTFLMLISWLVHTPVCGYILAFTGATLLTSSSSMSTWIVLGPIAIGLTLVWLAHLGALVMIWQSNAERLKLRWALAFPGGWLLIGLGYLLGQMSDTML